MQNFLRIHENDNVIVALQTIAKDEMIPLSNGSSVVAIQEIPAGHKMAIHNIDEGDDVIKSGYRIGIANESINAGDWIHTHNIKTGLGDLLEYHYEPEFVEESYLFTIIGGIAEFFNKVAQDGQLATATKHHIKENMSVPE